MATLYTHQESNILKTWLLVSLFFGLVIGLGWFVSYIYNQPAILYVAVLFSIVMNVTAYWFSDKIVLKMAKARPATKAEYPGLYTTVENLAITAGLPMPKVYVIDDSAPNAFATGRNKEHAVVAVTTGLMQMMENEELEGVIAHELGHIGNRDMLLSTVVVVLVGFVSIISDMFLRAGLYGRRNDERSGGIVAIVGLVFAILAPLAAMLIQLAISRRREFLADATGALLTRYPEGLARALEKIGSYHAPLRAANNTTAHLYISNPFGPQALRGLHKLFMTHPPIEERVRVLRSH
jgi:heat shock protein HtpX